MAVPVNTVPGTSVAEVDAVRQGIFDFIVTSDIHKIQLREIMLERLTIAIEVHQ